MSAPKNHLGVSSLSRERRLARLAIPTGTLCALSGFLTVWTPELPNWQQIVVLFHVLTGIAVSLIGLPYLWRHVIRINGIRNLSGNLSGVVSGLLFLLLMGSGLYILWFGQRESERWIFQGHVVFAWLIALAIILHGASHWLRIRQSPKDARKSYPGLQTISLASLLIPPLVMAGIGVLGINLDKAASTRVDQGVQSDSGYDFAYGPGRFSPSETQTRSGKFIAEQRIGNSQNCAVCHQQIAEQWRSSLHSQAASDPAYVANINLLEKSRGIVATRYCEGCHAPIALLSGSLRPGGKHGGVEGTVAFKEGVSCLACHAVRSVLHHRGVASYEWDDQRDYLFNDSQNRVLQAINRYLIRLAPGPHRQRMRPAAINQAGFCSTCHEQFMDKSMNGWGWIKLQSDYSHWLAGPYSGQGSEVFSAENRQRCQDCHMPLIASNGNDPSESRDGQLRSHHFPGANTAIPMLTGNDHQLALTRNFMRSNKLKLSIQPPEQKAPVWGRTTIESSLRKTDNPPSLAYVGDDLSFKIQISNIGVGHSFPGGTADINEAWLAVYVTDGQGRQIFSSGSMGSNQHVDPSAHFFRSRFSSASGTPIFHHDLFNVASSSDQNIIPAGGSDFAKYTLSIPQWAKSPLTITSVLRYRKFNRDYTQFVFPDNPPVLPITDMARDALSIPLLRRENSAQITSPTRE